MTMMALDLIPAPHPNDIQRKWTDYGSVLAIAQWYGIAHDVTKYAVLKYLSTYRVTG